MKFLWPLFAGLALALGSRAVDNAPVKVAKRGPAAYFEQSCAPCHGPRGTMFAPDFDAKYDDQSLAETILRMADGPGKAPLDPQEISAQVALHRAIARGVPFLSVTSYDGGVLRGEIVGAEAVTSAGYPAPVKVADGMWSVSVPLFEVPKLRLEAASKTGIAELYPGKASFSSLRPPG